MASDAGWRRGPDEPVLETGAVHVWRIGLEQSAEVMTRLDGHLDAAEQVRAGRFALERDRRRFVVAHGALREVLGRYMGWEPGEVPLGASAGGKPEIVHVGAMLRGELVEFNLAHSGEVALVAVTWVGRVGVDVERVRAEVEAEAIAERFFVVEERRALAERAEEERIGYFYALWTCKEAFVKARGTGLTTPLGSFVVRFDGAGEGPRVVAAEGGEALRAWSLVQLAPGEGYAGVLAVEGEIKSVMLWDWASDGA